MKRLNRYIFMEVAVPFFLSLFIFTFVLLLDRIMKLIELVVSRGVSIVDISLLFFYIVPSFLTLTIPMSFLLAVLLAFGRLSSDSEVIAMKASGVSLYQMLMPVSVLSILAYFFTLYLMIFALPWGNQSFKMKIFEIAKGKVSTGIKERTFNDDFEGIVLYVDRMKGAGELMEGVFIFDQREQAGFAILAKEGGIVSDPKTMTVSMRLADGEIHSMGKDLSYHKVSFGTYDLRLAFKGSTEKDQGAATKGDREMTVSELIGKVAELKGKGEDSAPYKIEIHKKFSIPFACIVFGLIGVPLGIQSKRSGRALGFVSSLVIFLVYYVFLTGGEGLGDKGVIPPFLAMWGANIIFFALGVYLILMVGKERPIGFLLWVDRAVDLIENLIKKLRGRSK